jgi:acyl-CoA synthetase (AMP-forming)/AMP-acid ligase II
MEFNIADLFESLVDVIADRTAVVCGARRLSYAELEARANRFAHALAARGVKAGDHVGLYLFNSTEFLEAMLGCFKIRAVPININYRYVEEELSFLFSNADLVALIHQREFAPRVAAVAANVPTLRTLVVVEDGSNAPLLTEAIEYETALKSASPERAFAPRSAKDHYIIYTGGTTGMPRGVMWQHEDVFFAGLQGGNPGGEPIERPEQLATLVKENPDPLTMFPAAPFIHGAAQWAALIGLFAGGKVVLLPGRSFNAKLACKAIAEEKVNTMTFVGDAMARPLVDALREANGSCDMSTLMVIASAGAILSDSVKEDLAQLLPETMILNNFGATETGHQGTMYPTGDGTPNKISFYMDASNTVLGDDQRPLEPGSGKIGRLARRGRLPIGYYKDPEKTAATFLLIDGERWVVPGDLATIEEDGKITVFGRGAVCINSGGEKIFPEEVEAALKAHPSVLDAVVVGVPDERWGQRVAAVIQARPGTEITLSVIDAHCRTRIAGYKVPRQLRLVDEIVRHPSGKPDYRWAGVKAREESAIS